MAELIIRNAIVGANSLDIGIVDGRIHSLSPAGATAPATDTQAERTVIDAKGGIVLPGFVESHIHLDKAYVADRAPGLSSTGPSAQILLAELKREFTVEDIYARARRGLEAAIRHGCTAMRAHIEIDPYVELRGVEAMLALKADFAQVIELQLVAFAQEGIFHDDRTCDLLQQGLRLGLDVLGGCPYMDREQRAHIDWFFATAEQFGVPLDFHADSSDDPQRLTCDYIAEQTIARGMQGRVLVGHLGLLDVLDPQTRAKTIDTLAAAELHVVSLPATELHVKGRGDLARTWRGVTRIGELQARGVNVAVSTNNIENPFTPFGHPDLLRQLLVTAAVAHLGNLDQLGALFDLITVNPAAAMGIHDYGLNIGDRADLVVLDAPSAEQAIIEQVEKLWVVQAGKVRARNRRESKLCFSV